MNQIHQSIKSKKILVVSGFSPYPPIFGGAIDVLERIKGLKSLGHQVDLIITDKINPTQIQLVELGMYVENFYFAKRKNQLQQLLGNLPLQLLSRKGLAKVEINRHYDLVILESEFCWPITLNKSITYNKIAVRVHNIESHYFKMLGRSSNSLKEKVYYKIETVKIKKLSSLVFDKVDRLWFISKDDLIRVNLADKSIFMPFPINQLFVSPFVKKGNTIVFMGSLFMQNNIFGLDWYLKNVHPLLELQLPNYHLYIVGSLKEPNEEIEKRYRRLPNVTLVINADCLLEYYQKAQVFINPMFHGSGVKVKSVNALVNGVPLVSTSIGAEGIGLTEDMYYPAETCNAFKEQILAVLGDRTNAVKKTLHAQEYLKKTNYLEVLKKELDALD